MSENSPAPALPAMVVIPARMASTRLPGKPLADICGAPMIVQVWRRAMEADVGPVVVAAAEPEIADAVTAAGGRAVLTAPDLPSGSDRIAEALAIADPEGRARIVVNVQGDLPTIDPGEIRAALRPMADPAVDIATLAAEIRIEEERTNPNVVKAVVAWQGATGVGRALYFTRATAPHGAGAHWHHIGLYAYRRDALTRFVRLPPSPLEQREKLEQLRALEAGMRIDVVAVDTVPLGVDTPEDLARARAIIESRIR
ncbi:3-deoxy-manno-octulosonate cytidylyltransferase [Zavarzinia compransoris]|uniref:3-deoxy-manno-octulosonate cytidylyltransferase n=1 Tax=Zavarzinia marina TaxID=2911065 RepID=UPI001F435805|nr:3-deoxy-manno-octulosonate cytidylyltransferase [Zavarzinia marina]MCF4165822.1 3-deoxy-manno-octulosonate cytidylyltransferase [Zavarzinia marina]